MSFRSNLVKRMIELDQDFISAICPKRTIDISKIISDVRSYESAIELQADKIISINSEYTGVPNVNADGAKSEVEMNRGFVKAKYTGMGICLIKRRVLEDMVTRAVVEKRENGPHPASPWPVPYYGFFHKRRASDGQFDSEDISFCKRWTQDCGGIIWACVDENIGHHGPFKYSGAYIEKLKAGRI